MKSRLIILLLALTTAGCSTIPTSTMPITMQSGKPVPTARIYQAELTVPSTGRSAKVSFLRDAGFLGGACTHKIFVDGKTVFAIRAGEFQTLHLAPGRHAFALEIEGGVCPAFSTSHSTVLADGAEETYRIFVPPLISPTLGTTIAAGPPQVQIVGATKGAARDSSDGLQGRIENGRYSAPNGKVMFSEGWRINFDGSGSSPVIADGVLYVGSADGAVYALDPSTGETKWRFQTGEGLSSLPQVITVPRGTSVDDQMAAGMEAARKQRTAGIRRVDMAPAVEDGTVFIGSGAIANKYIVFGLTTSNAARNSAGDGGVV